MPRIQNITRQHAVSAIADVDKYGYSELRASTGGDLIFEKRAYPPKVVISYANKYANGEFLPAGAFSGGVERGQASWYLYWLGFDIKLKGISFSKEFVPGSLADLGYDAAFVTRVVTERLSTANGSAAIEEIYDAVWARIADHLRGMGFAELPDRTKPTIREIVNRQMTKKGLVVKGPAGGWLLTDLGRESTGVLNLLKKQGFSDSAIDQTFSEMTGLVGSDKVASVKVRVGQERFRALVRDRWRKKCCVTGFSNLALLRASHIKPWRKAKGSEKVDPENGLLLSPSYDAAFDSGLISFSDDGNILLSEHLDPHEAEAIGISAAAKIDGLSDKNRVYLKHHREHHFYH